MNELADMIIVSAAIGQLLGMLVNYLVARRRRIEAEREAAKAPPGRLGGVDRWSQRRMP